MNAQKLDLVIRLLDTADAIMQELDFDSELRVKLKSEIKETMILPEVRGINYDIRELST